MTREEGLLEKSRDLEKARRRYHLGWDSKVDLESIAWTEVVHLRPTSVKVECVQPILPRGFCISVNGIRCPRQKPVGVSLTPFSSSPSTASQSPYPMHSTLYMALQSITSLYHFIHHGDGFLPVVGNSLVTGSQPPGFLGSSLSTTFPQIHSPHCSQHIFKTANQKMHFPEGGKNFQWLSIALE